MGVQYEYERKEDTYYIPISLMVSIQRKVQLMVWNELFQLSPDFSEFYLPDTIKIALDRFFRHLQDLWGKQSTSALGDKEQFKQLTSESASGPPEEEKTKYPMAPWHQGTSSASPPSGRMSRRGDRYQRDQET